MGSYGAHTLPIGLTRGSDESPRPPLSTGATGAVGATVEGIRFGADDDASILHHHHRLWQLSTRETRFPIE